MWTAFILLTGVALISGTSGADPLPTEAFVFNSDPQSEPLCFATILNSNWVITAASCVFAHREASLKLGVSRSVTRTDYDIGKLVFHPGFNRNTLANDIALINVQTPFRLEGEVASADLDLLYIRGGSTITLPGGIRGSVPTNPDCQSRLGPRGGLITDDKMCSVHTFSNSTDLGGSGVFRLEGLLTAVPSWQFQNIYVHSRVSAFVDWIDEVIKS